MLHRFKLLICCLFLALQSRFIASAQGYFGLDASVSLNATTWKCLNDEMSLSFATIRVYRNIGTIDTQAAPTLLAAPANLKDTLSAYIFPCVNSSQLSIDRQIVCPSLDDQVKSIVDYLNSNGINFKNGDTAVSAATAVASASATASTEQSSLTLQRLWLDVEDEEPPKYYDTNPEVNQQIIADLITAVQKQNIPLGMYTTKTYWQKIMGNVESPIYAGMPLWYPRYDGYNNMTFFSPFPNWENVDIKQTGGGVKLCGTDIDTNYADMLPK